MINRFTQDRSVGRPLGGRAGMIAAGLATAMLFAAGCSPDKPTPDTPPNRVLQSVNVQMTPDGTTTAIDGTAVSVRDNASDATTENTTYSPRNVADDLPVRVTTSYRTAKRSGTNLSDLKGYSGKVEIDLTVQNLTMKPQDLTYDVAGSSKTQPALVGSPLTVVASTTLPKTTPTNVITASAPGDSAATNGVLSQGDDGGSVVQWATLLAPPQTGANATLRLVTDAKNFEVPAFDLSVQPGLVTDPSVGGVLESAFNADPQSQLALEQRTIKVITNVNDTLTRASNDISNVRKNLESTSNTLGTRSLQELKTSTQGVATSMKGLDKELTSLNKDISSTLTTSQSTVLAQLGQTVGTMDQMLGDTSVPPPAPVVDRNGCKTVVKQPENADSVYGNLMQVTAQLNGYATATTECKKAAQSALVRSVGPEKPTEELCAEDKSTTCALFATEQEFGTIMSKLVDDGDDLVNSLQPEVVADARNQFGTLSDDMDDVKATFDKLDANNAYKGIDTSLADVNEALKSDTADDDLWDQVGALSDSVDDLESELQTIHDNSVSARQQIVGGDGVDHSMTEQNQEVADRLCKLAKSDLLSISRARINKLRGYLVDETCPDENGDTDQIGPPPLSGYDKPMSTRLDDQAELWKEVAAATDTQDADSDTGALLATLRNQIKGLKTQIDETQKRVNRVEATRRADEADLERLMKPLRKSVDNLGSNKNELDKDLTELAKWQRRLATEIPKTFQHAADTASKGVSDAIDPQIRKVTTQAKVDSKAVGEMFDESAAGLSNAADRITRNGTRTVEDQRRELKASEKHASGEAADRVDTALTQMAKGVSSSNRDMNSSSAQLADSLNKVLLDLGTRKVNGSGLLGSMTTSAAKVGTADYQLALASATTTSYANVRSEDINGILLRQAQLQASLQAGADLPAFHLTVPSGAQSQTVYTFRIEAGK
ncbi:MAG TPA: hypothetical protein VIP98_17885 [Microlunatus sp.]